MGIFNKLRGGGDYPKQPAQKTQFGAPGRMPPGPPARPSTKGGPPPISTMSQADKDNKGIQLKIQSTRMTADQHRMSGGHASADTYYRRADEMESRLKQGAPQLDDNAMSKIRPSQNLRDTPGSGWGNY